MEGVAGDGPRGAARGTIRRGLITLLTLAGVLAGTTGCGGPAPPEVPVPTFPSASTGVGPAAVGVDDPGIPDDCLRVLNPEDLVAVLGLPLGSVAVRTTVGVPEPSVGRVERVACRYTGTAGRVAGLTLLELNAARYVDEGAAARQWRLNVDATDGLRQGVRIGVAQAVLFEERGSSRLSVVHADVATTLTLPAGAPTTPGRSAAETLTDLAVRVLAGLTPPGGEEFRVAAG